MSLLANRSILVTGGAGGIGIACARALLEAGAEVVVADLPGPRLEETRTELSAIGPVHVIDVDLSDMGVAAQLPRQAASLSSHGRIDGLVNGVGIMRTVPLQEATHEQWRQTMDVNLNAVFATLQAAANAMANADGGAVVTLASVAGRSGRPAAADYAATKTALLSLTKSAAMAYAPTVRVNAVCPGAIWTPMWEKIVAERDQEFGEGAGQRYLDEVSAKTPMRRIGQAEEIADAVTYLLSEKASFITGQALNVDGGLEMD